ERVDICPPAEGTHEHLAAYADVDIILDTLPYNGTTTACDALLMGVPVVTMRGASHAGRVAETILRRVGLEDLGGEDQEAYARKAVELARDAPRRAALRKELRGRLLGSCLCDGAAHAARLCDALYEAWRAA